MINRDIEQISKDDLQSLIDNEVTERKTIEYKQALPGNSEREKKEFLEMCLHSQMPAVVT